MAKVIYSGPMRKQELNPNPEYLKLLLLQPPPGYWSQGAGDASIDYREPPLPERTLIVMQDNRLGFYLKYLEAISARVETEWLSLGDRSRLKQVIDCDDWKVSVGLFIGKEAAANAVAEFAKNGTRSTDVVWIQPEEVPPEGNY